MAWSVNGTALSFCEGDFGIELPVKVNGVTLGSSDCIRFTFKDGLNGSTILEKDFDSISQNTVNLVLTDAESELFSVGRYVYSLDWYQDGNFMCNIISSSPLKVVDKA